MSLALFIYPPMRITIELDTSDQSYWRKAIRHELRLIQACKNVYYKGFISLIRSFQNHNVIVKHQPDLFEGMYKDGVDYIHEKQEHKNIFHVYLPYRFLATIVKTSQEIWEKRYNAILVVHKDRKPILPDKIDLAA